MAQSQVTRHGAHPTPLTYLKVAIILAILTGVEVGVFYIDFLEPVFLPIFLLLSVAKFCLVVLFYMHLKFDSRLFSTLFVGGLLLAIAVSVAIMSLFQVLSATANEPETPTPTPTIGPTPTANTNSRSSPTSTSIPAPVELAKQIFLFRCSDCHKIDGVFLGGIGPDPIHRSVDAARKIPGMPAEENIKAQRVGPEVFPAPGAELVTTGHGVYTEGVTDTQVYGLVQFLSAQI